MDLVMVLLCAVVAYLLGSLNFGIIFTKIFTGTDLRSYGSGNAGSTNAYRVLGSKALLVVLGDALKGIVAVLIGRALFGETGQLCAYIFVLFGHAYPVFYNFRGGKGILTTGFAMLVIDWRVAAVMLVAFLVVVLVTRYVSLGSIVGVGLLPFAAYFFGSLDLEMVICILFMSMWAIMLHRENIARLTTGTERRFSFRRKPEDGAPNV